MKLWFCVSLLPLFFSVHSYGSWKSLIQGSGGPTPKTDSFKYACVQSESVVPTSSITGLRLNYFPSLKELVWTFYLEISPNVLWGDDNPFLGYPNILGPFRTSPEASNDQSRSWAEYERALDQHREVWERRDLKTYESHHLNQSPVQFKNDTYLHQTSTNPKFGVNEGPPIAAQGFIPDVHIQYNISLLTLMDPIDSGDEQIFVEIYLDFLNMRLIGEGQRFSAEASNHVQMTCTRSDNQEEAQGLAPNLVPSESRAPDYDDDDHEMGSGLGTVLRIQSLYFQLSDREKGMLAARHQERLRNLEPVVGATVALGAAGLFLKRFPVLGTALTSVGVILAAEPKASTCPSPNLFENIQNLGPEELLECVQTSPGMSKQLHLLFD